MLTKALKPTDDYDVEGWMNFYAENPGYLRSAGAAGDNEDPPADPPKKEDPPADPPKKEDPPADPSKPEGKTPTDEEARLLKEVMKQKAKSKETADALAAAQAALKAFDGVNVEKYNALVKAEAEAAEAAALARGEFDTVKKQMSEAHATAIAAKETELAAANDRIAALQAQIDDLTVGSSFDQSKFITEETVLTPRKARQLYGAHFDLVDGKVVGYDKPKSDKTRAPLVDGMGEPLAFSEAIKKVIESDPDKDHLLRATLKPGADSKPGAKTGEQAKPARELKGAEKIAAGVPDLMKQIAAGGGAPVPGA